MKLNPFTDSKITHHDKQLILYSKNWFNRADTITDIKQIAASKYGLPVEMTSNFTVYHFVASLFITLQAKGYINRNLQDFIINLFANDEKICYRDMIERMLREVSIINVIGLDIGEPDYTLLNKKQPV